MLPIAYVVSEQLAKVASLLPSNTNRSLVVHSLVKRLGLLDGDAVRVITPSPATRADICSFHDERYIDHLLGEDPPQESNIFGLIDDCPSFRGLPLYVALTTGAVLTAARAIASENFQNAVVWDGGRHHAQKAAAAGFCYVNDCVLAILQLQKSRKPRPRILYLDLDLHYSDGVSNAFLGSSNVMTISVHHASPGFYPVSPPLSTVDPYTISIPLATGASDITFSRIWPAIERLKTGFAPDFIVAQCGVDGLAGDPCKTWNWSLGENEGSLGWCIDRIVNTWDVPSLFLGGGGYNSPNAARAWAYLTSIIAKTPISPTSAIPENHIHFPLYAPSFTLNVEAGYMQDKNENQAIDRTLLLVDTIADRLKGLGPEISQS